MATPDLQMGACGARTSMTDFGYPDLKRIALKALAQRAGQAAGDESVATAVQHAYDDLARAAAPLIGQVGIDALTGRMLYLVNRKYPWIALTHEAGEWTGPLAPVIACLKQQTPAIAMDAAGAMFATLAGLIATLVGEPLATHLLQGAWPDVVSDARTREK
jgi:hypothetical protein